MRTRCRKQGSGHTHDNVGAGVVNALAGSLAVLLPDALHGESAQLDGFRGAGSRRTDGFGGVRGVPEAGEHGDAPGVNDLCSISRQRAGRCGRKRRTRHRILVLVDEVLGHGFLHELVGLLGHPCMDEGREVEEGGAIQRELVVNELIGRVCVGALCGEDEPRAADMRGKRTLDGMRNLGMGSVP